MMGASPLLQAMRAHRRRSAQDVSLPFLAILWCGGMAWLAYGVALGNAALIVANTVGVLCSGTALAVSVRWSRRAAAVPAEPRSLAPRVPAEAPAGRVGSNA